MLFVLLIFVVWPLLEIAAAVLVARALGVIPMLGLVGLASVAGLFALQREGRSAWNRFNQAVSQRRAPSRDVGDGLIGFLGGVLLVIPGLVSGLVGVLLVLPPTKALGRWLIALLVARRLKLGTAAAWTYTYASNRTRRDYDVTGTAEEIPEREIGDTAIDERPRGAGSRGSRHDTG